MPTKKSRVTVKPLSETRGIPLDQLDILLKETIRTETKKGGKKKAKTLRRALERRAKIMRKIEEAG